VSLRLLFSVQASDEIDAAVTWLGEHYGDVSEQWYTNLKAALAELKEHPERHPLSDDSALATVRVREMLFGRRRRTYRVWYRVEGDAVRILSVRHHSQGPIGLSDLPI
jgi:plasmid stabilization system protein ParE